VGERKAATRLEQQDETEAKPEQEFRHEVLEDCIIDGIYRAKGEIIFSTRKLVPHCSAIE
jgi:hypothetical protein